MKTILAALLSFLAASTSHAIDIVGSDATGNQVNLGGTYTQNFDSLPSAPPPLGGYRFTNDATLPGWYSTHSSFGTAWESVGLSSWGTDADRAFGSPAANWSLRFVNTTSQTITAFSVSYDVEQWFRGANSPQVTNSLHLYYRVYSASISEAVEVGNMTSPGWTHVPSATFTSPNATLTTASLLDGNLPENRGDIEVAINGISFAPDQKLWLQWITGNEPGNDHALATDNVSVSFSTIPEPASAASLLGLASLVFAARRRRHRP